MRDDPLVVFPIKIGTYPILLNNTTVTQPSMSSNHLNYGNQSQLSASSFHSRPYNPSVQNDDIGRYIL